jgi:hypothetical protein
MGIAQDTFPGPRGLSRIAGMDGWMGSRNGSYYSIGNGVTKRADTTAETETSHALRPKLIQPRVMGEDYSIVYKLLEFLCPTQDP